MIAFAAGEYLVVVIPPPAASSQVTADPEPLDVNT